MSLFPKFKIPSYTPATLATPATNSTFRAKSSRNSKSSNPIDTPKPDFGVSGHDDTPGVTAANVLQVFCGGRVLAENKPIGCQYCDKQNIPAWRRGGEIVQRIWPNRRSDWGCHFCGRASGTRIGTGNGN